MCNFFSPRYYSTLFFENRQYGIIVDGELFFSYVNKIPHIVSWLKETKEVRERINESFSGYTPSPGDMGDLEIKEGKVLLTKINISEELLEPLPVVIDWYSGTLIVRGNIFSPEDVLNDDLISENVTIIKILDGNISSIKIVKTGHTASEELKFIKSHLKEMDKELNRKKWDSRINSLKSFFKSSF